MRGSRATSVALLLVAGIVMQSSAWAEPPKINCAKIMERAKRLTCYDQSAKRAIVAWSGEGSRTIRPFHVDGPWEVQWNNQSDSFALFVDTKDGDGTENVPGGEVHQTEPGTGSSYISKGGDYFIEVLSMGRWIIRVVLRPQLISRSR